MNSLAAHSPRYTALAILLALAMIPVFGAAALDTRLFQGINVWIKPLKFLTALVIYLVTIAWFARYAAPEITGRARWRWHERAIVVAVLLEMIWIGGAAAMGVGSHFNRSTPAMGAIYGLMGFAALLLISSSLTLARAIHRNKNSTLPPAMRTGLVWGLTLTFVLTAVTASRLSMMGGHWIGGEASDVGGLMFFGWARDGGDLRVAHFFATHAMHAVPLAALLCVRLFGGAAVAPVRALALAYTAFVGFTMVQAQLGQPFLPGLAALFS
jgi:hypothetical protein